MRTKGIDRLQITLQWVGTKKNEAKRARIDQILELIVENDEHEGFDMRSHV
jgi:hypothetical protein